MALFWEHAHAYQPRRIVDGIRGTERAWKRKVVKRVVNRKVRGKNLFEVVLAPSSVYDEIVSLTVGRSIDIEPITLEALERLNKPAYDKLVTNVLSGKTSILATSYSHPVLPLMADESELDLRLNLKWSLHYYHDKFPLWQAKHGGKLLGFWLPECALSKKVIRILLEVLDEMGKSWGWREGQRGYLILDEDQMPGVDPSRPFSLEIGRRKCFVLFRYHGLSVKIGLCSELKAIMRTFWGEVDRCRFGLIGAANDAESYGGNYDPNKPVLLRKMREKLRKAKIETATAIDCIGNWGGKVERVEPIEYSSWTDYGELNRLKSIEKQGTPFEWEYYVGEKPGGLCRWSGLEREPDGSLSRRSYFLIFPHVDPRDNERYVRVISAMWKAAFNELRKEVANLVRSNVLSLLRKYVKRGKMEEFLANYWACAVGRETPDDFLARMNRDGLLRPRPERKELKAIQVALHAYKLACQDSRISCPTFWWLFENELTWTSLSYSAAAMAQIVIALHGLGMKEKAEGITKRYKEIFLRFGEGRRWKRFVETLDTQLPLMFDTLEQWAREKGYEVSTHLSDCLGTEPMALAREISRRLYESALGDLGKVKPGDENPHLVLAKFHELRGEKKKAVKHWKRAKWYEWEKCLRSHYSDKNVVQRVGLLHARYFPKYQSFFGISRDDVKVETKTLPI